MTTKDLEVIREFVNVVGFAGNIHLLIQRRWGVCWLILWFLSVFIVLCHNVFHTIYV